MIVSWQYKIILFGGGKTGFLLKIVLENIIREEIMKKIAALLCLLLLFGIGCTKKDPTPVEHEEPVPVQADPVELPPEKKDPELPGIVIAMIDNHNRARPQSGLDKADVVYEIIAEGGITRYMALFYSQRAEKVGPIRSARYYFVQLARGYDSPYAHAGGNNDALQLIAQLKMKDLDEIYNSGEYFYRDKSRKMPHNLYTSTGKLVEGAQKKGYKLIPLELPLGDSWSGEDHQDIKLDYGTRNFSYIVTWRYEDGKYHRLINDKAHVMQDGTPITAQNILVFAAPTKEVVKEELQSEVDLIGKGDLLYFIEGQLMEGKWEKASETSAIKYTDNKGQPLQLKDGKTWIQVLPSFKNLTY